jgi:hypothetical protein
MCRDESDGECHSQHSTLNLGRSRHELLLATASEPARLSNEKHVIIHRYGEGCQKLNGKHFTRMDPAASAVNRWNETGWCLMVRQASGFGNSTTPEREETLMKRYIEIDLYVVICE